MYVNIDIFKSVDFILNYHELTAWNNLGYQGLPLSFPEDKQLLEIPRQLPP